MEKNVLLYTDTGTLVASAHKTVRPGGKDAWAVFRHNPSGVASLVGDAADATSAGVFVHLAAAPPALVVSYLARGALRLLRQYDDKFAPPEMAVLAFAAGWGAEVVAAGTAAGLGTQRTALLVADPLGFWLAAKFIELDGDAKELDVKVRLAVNARLTELLSVALATADLDFLYAETDHADAALPPERRLEARDIPGGPVSATDLGLGQGFVWRHQDGRVIPWSKSDSPDECAATVVARVRRFGLVTTFDDAEVIAPPPPDEPLPELKEEPWESK